MADLVLITAEPTHDAATETEAALESELGGSHTVTIVDDSLIAGVSWGDYDAIVVCRPTAESSTISATIRGRADAGQPVFWGLVEASGADGDSTAATLAHLCGTINIDSFARVMRWVDTTHPITEGFEVNGTTTMYSSNTSGVGLQSEDGVGDYLANTERGTGQGIGPGLYAIEAGTLDLEGDAIGARIVLWGMLYGSTGYTDDAKGFMAGVIEWLMADPDTGDEGGGAGRMMMMGVG